MSGLPMLRVTAQYVGGPLDGHEVDVPLRGSQWARYTDPDSHTQYYYELTWSAEGYEYIYRPGAKP